MTSSTWRLTLTVDGHRLPVDYGPNFIWVPAGMRRVALDTPGLFSSGYAAMSVNVPPDGAVQIYYAPPVGRLRTRGSIGLVPQRQRGLRLLVALVVAAMVVPAVIMWLVLWFAV